MFEVRRRVRSRSYLLIYFFIAMVLIMAHGPLLQLPYYWDEAGQFIPAATDLYKTGSWISHSATPNVHPPGVMAWLALTWHIFGFSILTTRVAMMMLACFGVLTTFLLAIELSRGSPGTPAFAAVALLCVSPLFYAQSILAQLDMPAMGFTALALLLFLQDRFRDAAVACVALVLVKETGVVVPAVLAAWLVFEPNTSGRRWREALWFLMPVAALLAWLSILRHDTGHWFGNAEFAQYNLVFTLNPARFIFSILRRLYYLFIGSGHFIGTAAVWWAFHRMPLLRDRPWRVAATLLAAHVITVTALGGAVLERYLLPVLPILYIAFAVSFRAVSLRTRQMAMAGLVICLIAANFINPPYPFPFENNLAFVSFVNVQREAAFAADTYPGVVATTFPMTTALAQPDNGFLKLPHEVRELPDFRPATIAALESDPPPIMLVYDTALDPWHIRQSHAFQWFFGRFYQYERPMSASEISQLLRMRVARRIDNNGISMFLLVNDAMINPGTFTR
jgi:4-amino-4-deoxy-L-arabinose transferase-like glycosyltransferase